MSIRTRAAICSKNRSPSAMVENGTTLEKTTRNLIALTLIVATSGCANMGPGVDKLGHMTAGIAASKYVTQRTGSPLAGCMASIALGIAKEAYDSTGRGTVDRNDAIATASGAGCAFSFAF